MCIVQLQEPERRAFKAQWLLYFQQFLLAMTMVHVSQKPSVTSDGSTEISSSGLGTLAQLPPELHVVEGDYFVVLSLDAYEEPRPNLQLCPCPGLLLTSSQLSGEALEIRYRRSSFPYNLQFPRDFTDSFAEGPIPISSPGAIEKVLPPFSLEDLDRPRYPGLYSNVDVSRAHRIYINIQMAIDADDTLAGTKNSIQESTHKPWQRLLNRLGGNGAERSRCSINFTPGYSVSDEGWLIMPYPIIPLTLLSQPIKDIIKRLTRFETVSIRLECPSVWKAADQWSWRCFKEFYAHSENLLRRSCNTLAKTLGPAKSTCEVI